MQRIRRAVPVSWPENRLVNPKNQPIPFVFLASSKSGNVGVLFLVQNESDLEFITSHPPSPPYAAIVTPKLFTRENILKLRDSEFISAIVLINDTRGMQSFSEESRCPNSFFTHVLQPKCDVNKPEKTWNPYGTGLLQENFDIPIIFLSSKNESEKVLKCFNDFNKDPETHKDGSLCSIEVNSFMSAAGNSEICMRRSNGLKLINQIHYCDPMQGKNVYATLFPRPIVDPDNRTNDKNEKIILISSHLDTTSMFDGLGDGATELASLTTLITAGHYLRKIIPNEVYERNNINVMFVIFNGESYDFIGSQRLVYDLKKGDAFPLRSSYSNPLKLENIMMMIDIGSLDSLTDLNFYHLKDTDMSKKFIDSVNYYKNKFNFSTQITTNLTNNIPPVSAQSFLRENITFPAFVLATAEPENKFYHSIYDDKANLNFTYHNTSKDFDVLPSALDNLGFDEKSVQIKIRNVASLLALAVYDMLSNDFKYKDNLVASPVLVDEFLFCYLDATKCSLFKAIFELTGNFQGSDYPPPRYISVQPAIILEATFWAHRTFGYVLSEKVADVKKENCTFLPLYWIPGSQLSGECRRMTQNYSFALSPAFLEDGYNFKSNQYSTWTESTWNELSARIFLKPSATHQSLTFSIGFVVMIISFVIVYLVNSKTDVLFAEVAVEQ